MLTCATNSPNPMLWATTTAMTSLLNTKYSMPSRPRSMRPSCGWGRGERERQRCVGWLASRRLVSRPGLSLPTYLASAHGGADSLGRQNPQADMQAVAMCRRGLPAHLGGNKMDVDQVLDGPRPAHANAQLLTQSAAGAVSGDKVLPCTGRRAQQAEVCSQGTRQRAGVHHGVFVACLCWAPAFPTKL